VKTPRDIAIEILGPRPSDVWAGKHAAREWAENVDAAIAAIESYAATRERAAYEAAAAKCRELNAVGERNIRTDGFVRHSVSVDVAAEIEALAGKAAT
jgi:hypothetical protein